MKRVISVSARETCLWIQPILFRRRGSINATEFAAFEIADGLADFFGSIHHKRTIADDGFVNRDAGEQKDFDFFAVGFYVYVAAAFLKADVVS